MKGSRSYLQFCAIVMVAALVVAVSPKVAYAGLDPDPRMESVIFGQVIDEDSGNPISAAHVRVREIGRNELSHADGTFHLRNLAAGSYTVVVQRLGYRPTERVVRIGVADTVNLTIELRRSALDIAGVVVTGAGRERGAHEVYQPTTVLSDAELRRRLESTLPATIAREPGISTRQFGPAASAPVIRGMGGDRILVLEDGQRVGDLHTTADDHGVAIDPLTAERIEIVRGPAGLLYGSNALGGVVNVIRHEVPRSVPERISGTISTQAESASRGVSGGGVATIPVGERFAVRAEATGRRAGDVRTPLGPFEQTGLENWNASIGASLVTGWGHVGIAGRLYRASHGIPGAFQGEVIPGGHPGGVDVEADRRSVRLEAAHLAGAGPFSGIELDANLTHYLHDEIEAFQDGAAVFGARFDQITGGANLIARHDHEAGEFHNEGALGLSFRGRDLLAIGRSPGTRAAMEWTAGAYGYEEFGLGPARVQIGGRYDWTRVTPRNTLPIEVAGRVIPVAERTFEAFSASLGGLYDIGPGMTAGLTVARGFRTPAVEELFSDGPHLADYSFNIGNPELEPEIGHGVDAFFRISRPRIEAEVAAFRNAIRGYIYYHPTGEEVRDFLRMVPVYEARSTDAVFHGAEARVQWEPISTWVMEASVSAVRADRVSEADPLPRIPPADGSIRVRHDPGPFFVTAGWDGTAAQDRVPARIPGPDGQMIWPDPPTEGHGLWNLGGGVRWGAGERFHTVTIKVQNLLDTEWRDHMARTRTVAPQQGRNLQVLYRLNY